MGIKLILLIALYVAFTAWCGYCGYLSFGFAMDAVDKGNKVLVVHYLFGAFCMGRLVAEMVTFFYKLTRE